MANIDKELNEIKNAIYGKDVRGAIHDGIEKVYNDATKYSGEKDMEVVLARGSHSNLNDRLNKTDQQLAQTQEQKADKSYVQSGLLNKRDKSVPIGLNDADSELLGAIQNKEGETNFNLESIPRDHSTTPIKTTFARDSKNLFDKDNVEQNKSFGSGGNIIDDTTSVLSGFKTVIGGQDIALSSQAIVVQYDENKGYLQQSGNSRQNIYLLKNTRFIRVATTKSRVDELQLEYGTESTAYEEYDRVMIDNLHVSEKNLNDTVADKINNSLSQEFFKATNKTHEYPNKIFNLLAGDHEISLVNSELTMDESIVWKGATHKVVCAGTATSEVRFNPTNPIKIPPSSGVGMWVFIKDITNITSVALDLYHNEALNPYWQRNSNTLTDFQLKDGWNLLRWDASDANTGDWKEIYRIRVRIYCTEKVVINIGSIFLESNDKARLIIVNDGARRSWLNIAYPALKQRGFPTTWAINPNRFDSAEDKMTEDELLSLRYDLESSFSFHSWGSGTPTAQMSEREIREDVVRCVRYLKSKGLASDYIWRAAVHQNLAPHHRINDDLLLASATHTGKTGTSPSVFPFTNPYDIPRVIMHGMTNAAVDSLFASLKKFRGVIVGYTHGIYETKTSFDMTFEQWDYFLQKIDEGISEGWLEGTTFEDLYGQIANNKQVNELEQLTIATMI